VGIWNEILTEVGQTKDILGGPNSWDIVRRKHLKNLADYTGRPTIVYATAFFDSGPKGRGDVSIHSGDKEGFLEVTRGLPKGALDVILHSPGGTAEGAETIVLLLREKFDNVRFIIPIAAKSAATMLALSGNELVGGIATELGPIDPQFRMARPDRGPFNAPALAIKKQFAMADEAVSQDKAKLPLWIPLISQFGPSLLAECDQALDLSKSLVREWLRAYMFKDEEGADARADAIANDLTDWDKYKSHGRAVMLQELEALGAHVVWLRDDDAFSDLVWHAWYGVSITLQNTNAMKLFENHEGECQVLSMEVRVVQEGPAPPAAPQPNREQRRHPAKGRR